MVRKAIGRRRLMLAFWMAGQGGGKEGAAEK